MPVAARASGRRRAWEPAVLATRAAGWLAGGLWQGVCRVRSMRRNTSAPGSTGRTVGAVSAQNAPVSVSGITASVSTMMASAFGGEPMVHRQTSAGTSSRATAAQGPIALPKEYFDDIGRTPDALESVSRLCHLAARGDLAGLKAKASTLRGTQIARAASLDNRTPLHFAAAAGQTACCEWLLEQGVPVNAVDAFGLTPLAEAVRWSHRDLARMLHAKGARLLINGMLVSYHNFDAQVPLLNASMTDEDWEIDGSELKTDGMVGQGSFGLIYKAAWRGTPVAIKQIHIKQPPLAPAGGVKWLDAEHRGAGVSKEGGSHVVIESLNTGQRNPVAGDEGSGGADDGRGGSGAGDGGGRGTLGISLGPVLQAGRFGGGGGVPSAQGSPPAQPPSEDVSLENIVAELREELYLMSHLHHPHILQFLGAVTKPGPHSPAIVMELADRTLAQRFKEMPPLTLAGAMSAAIHVARAMAYLHGHRPHAIIHRDLKPSNVLRAWGGVWKVCDFGLSRLLPGKAMADTYRLTGETGSYVYMAPEVYRHESYSLKVDQYAFAMILYQAFQKERPFPTLKPLDAARAAATGRRPDALGRIPTPVREIVLACWSHDPGKRPSFDRIVQELTDYATARGLSAASHYSQYESAGARLSGSCDIM